METRALITKQNSARSFYAAGLLVALLAALLGAWFFSGWHDVRMRQLEVRNQPRAAADARAEELARELHNELEGLIAREVRRPYFHYQNLMHDPRASAGLSVSPSPLAGGPEDRFVLGYFQLDAKGRATTPTINDEVPELSEPDNLAGNRSFRDQVVRDLSGDLSPATTGVLVAEVTPRPQPPRPRPQQPAVQQQAQVIEIDPSVYTQNTNANAVYWQQHDNNNAQVANMTPQMSTQRVTPPNPNPTTNPTNPTTNPSGTNPVTPRTTPRVAPTPTPPAPVTITVSPLEWRTLVFAGGPSLVAVRQVQTPDGNLAQGFVVDRASLTGWLASKAGEMVAELHPADLASRGVDIAPGWQLTVAPNPRSIGGAASAAADVARTFLIRFIAIGSIAAIAAAFVLLLVMRAEKLARERSQFAAAAAHELRTPLAGLQLYGDMLADGLGDPGKVKDYAKRMSEEAARLGRVVSNVLGFSQLERGNLSVDAQVSDLGAVLCELAERAQPALDRSGAALDLDVQPDLRARFDRDALTRIIGNLLDNAEKYARTAEDRTIGLAAHDKGDAIEVVVSDRGPGVADKTPLFQPFSRGVPSDGPAGLGLGLALSQSLAHAMGGELAYRPVDGGGASFVLKLPRA